MPTHRTCSNATLFSPLASFCDVINAVGAVTARSMLLTLGCMAAVCALTIMRVGETLVAIVCVASICAGVMGNLHWWHVTLDPITMAFSVMAGGFGVDYAAHIAYHYASCTDRRAPANARLADTFHVIGWPMVQAGASTALCMCSQLWAPLIAFRVLLKTVLLVVACGLLHGLFLLPVMLSLLPSSAKAVNKKTGKATLNNSECNDI